MAHLDAAIRMVSDLVVNGGIRRNGEAEKLLDELLRNGTDTTPNQSIVPLKYWRTLPCTGTESSDDWLMLRTKGAVMLSIQRSEVQHDSGSMEWRKKLPADLRAAVEEPPIQPTRVLLNETLRHGMKAFPIWLPSLLASMGAAWLLVLLMRGVFSLTVSYPDYVSRLLVLFPLLALALLAFGFETLVQRTVRSTGRAIEGSLRAAFIERIPDLPPKYFHTRLPSDLSERFHGVHTIRSLTELISRMIRGILRLAFALTGILLLSPDAVFLVCMSVMMVVGLVVLVNALLTSHDLRQRSHAGALSRYYLDSLLGLISTRSHGAEDATLREHESQLRKWARSNWKLSGLDAGAVAISHCAGVLVAALIIFQYLAGADGTANILLMVFWSLQIPAAALDLGQALSLFRPIRNRMLRYMEPMTAPGQPPSQSHLNGCDGHSTSLSEIDAVPTSGFGIAFVNVSVVISDKRLLTDVSFSVEPGSHVAVLGPSGAGKSTLVGLLLGSHIPSMGKIQVDSSRLTLESVPRVRKATAWIDPSAQLWNRSLLDNIQYGHPESVLGGLDRHLEAAQLIDVLKELPQGLQTRLGEGGSRLSGGEGQRVRLARSLLKNECRLAILDEPFRGLDRSDRRRLIKMCRTEWRRATLFCVTHDISDTKDFDQVIVLEKGKIVECGVPQKLLDDSESRYSRMMRADYETRRRFLRHSGFRPIHLQGGKLFERDEAL